MNSINEMAIAKKDYKLANGRIIPIGMNFRSLQLMTAYKGGFKKLDQDIKSKELNVQLDACAYLLYCLIRATGEEVTIEQTSMMIGIEDFDKLLDIFGDYSKAVEEMQKKTELKQRKLKK